MNSELGLVYPEWPAPANVLAYCSTRHGGVSAGNYASLNVGLHVDDNPADVEENRQRLPASHKITWLEQVHGFDVIELPSNQTTADASISRSVADCCAVMTADCVPVLLCNAQGTEVAAIHAGWKGLVLTVIEKTVSRLHSQPSQLMAWIGPAICQHCYEVSELVAERFCQYPGAVKGAGAADKYLLDLVLVAHHQLTALGVKNIIRSGYCTYCDDRFFSHRAATHKGLAHCGRQVSVIGFTNI